MMNQFTVTGAFVDRTLFERANVPLPGPGASWDDGAEVARKVAEATGTPALVDDGFRAFMAKFLGRVKDGTMARDVWVSQGGTAYQDTAQEFINVRFVYYYYYSGSWQTARFETAIGDAFDREVVGSPCGPAASSGMPGGAVLVGFKRTAHPEAVAKVIYYFASEPVHAQLVERTENVPAHKGIAAKGLAYPDASPAGRRALQAWSEAVGKV